MMKNNRELLRLAKKGAVGVAVSAPLLALVQGSLLLYDYRKNHSNAPRPHMPSSGIVVVSSDPNDPDYYLNHGKTTLSSGWNRLRRPPRQEPPLRLLVVGDSLAAGVGIRASSTPILPRAVAASLSRALGGRAVCWTCIGTPGLSSTLLVQEIHNLQDDFGSIQPVRLLRELEDWQRESRHRARFRLREARAVALEWWEHRRDDRYFDEGEDDTRANERNERQNSIEKWISETVRKARRQIERDVNGIMNVFRSLRRRPDEVTETPNFVTLSSARSLRRYRTVDPGVVGHYDIAIVLTGLNDLKDALLPFMMSQQRKRKLRELNNGKDSSPLERILEALQESMDFAPDRLKKLLVGISKTEDAKQPRSDKYVDAEQKFSAVKKRLTLKWQKGPLVVFPALPVGPTLPSNMTPLKWFFGPVISWMDRSKKTLAEMYPNLVVFVDKPSNEIVDQTVARTGPLWASMDESVVLLDITDYDDISKAGSKHITDLMKDYHESFVKDFKVQSNTREECHVLSQQRVADQSTLVSADGIHPSDEGYVVPCTCAQISADSFRRYDFWGRYIAFEIIKHLSYPGHDGSHNEDAVVGRAA